MYDVRWAFKIKTEEILSHLPPPLCIEARHASRLLRVFNNYNPSKPDLRHDSSLKRGSFLHVLVFTSGSFKDANNRHSGTFNWCTKYIYTKVYWTSTPRHLTGTNNDSRRLKNTHLKVRSLGYEVNSSKFCAKGFGKGEGVYVV